jgi:hypothetical protein
MKLTGGYFRLLGNSELEVQIISCGSIFEGFRLESPPRQGTPLDSFLLQRAQMVKGWKSQPLAKDVINRGHWDHEFLNMPS